MTIAKNLSLNRSPLAVKIENVEIVKLTSNIQKRLGCTVNKDVFLECPYAFVSRQELLEISREENSILQDITPKIVAYQLPEVLIGYASDRINTDETGDFVICLTEESRDALISRNRDITKNILKIVQEEIIKFPKSIEDLEISTDVEDKSSSTTRSLYEIEVSLPVTELRHKKRLSQRKASDVRDGYVELTPLYEDFQNVTFTTLTQSCQTNLESRNELAQTYPGNPKNQWTQYEFEVPGEIQKIWKCEEEKEEEEEEEDIEEIEEGASVEIKEEVKKTEEELQFEEKKRQEWEKLSEFMKINTTDMFDAVSFNASTNLYQNDVANLSQDDKISIFAKSCKNYEEKITLIDLKTIEDRYLYCTSWHYELENVLISAYLHESAKNYSLIALWSLWSPLRPKMLIECEDRISTLSFCPFKYYTNVCVAGCFDGKVLLWEICKQLLVEQEDQSERRHSRIELDEAPQIKEAKIATSSEKVQKQSITSIQWLPHWCCLQADGNFQRVSTDSPRDSKVCFTTSSIDGSIFFWSLPKSLSTPATIRSPLQLSISPIYQLMFEEPGEKIVTRIPITCFIFPLAKNEECSSLSIRDQADLERLRKVFVGTRLGEIMYCTWESQTFSVDISDREVCKIVTRSCIHDGIVRTMIKSPHLDDVFLTVGGKVFAIWKEDFAQSPIFQRRSTDCMYGDGCWSGRSGMFVLARLDGCFELWDLKRKCYEPILIQTISGKVTPYIFPNSPNSKEKLLAILDGASTLRIFVEPNEICKDADIVRIEWFEEFAWRETKRKLEFNRWQDDYLCKHPTALKRKQEREQAEAARKHKEARDRYLKDQEALALAKAEQKLAKRRVSKSVVWRSKELKRAEDILLQKKGFIPKELEDKRKPLIELEEQRRARSIKVKQELSRADEILEKYLAREIPETKIVQNKEENKLKDRKKSDVQEILEKSSSEHEEEYRKVKEELTKKLKEQPYVPIFDWKKAMKSGVRRMKSAEMRKEF